jgi:hypothetical protein
MIKIEVTGNSIPEVADKLLAIGHSLYSQTVVPIANGGTGAQTPEEVLGVAEAAPVDPTPAPAVAETVSSPSDTATVQPEPSESSETAKNTGASSASSGSAELNFDIDVAPYVLQVVKEKGKPVAQEILSQFGVEKASLLDPALWPELVQQLKDAL